MIHNDPLKFSMQAKDVNWTKNYFRWHLYSTKSYWDPKGLLDNISFEEINSRSFEETDKITDWFNNFNHADNGFKPEN